MCRSRPSCRQANDERLGRVRADRTGRTRTATKPRPAPPQALDSSYPALASLRAQGVVDAIGVGMNHAEMLVRFVRHADPDLLVVANTCTLLRRSALTELLPLCMRANLAAFEYDLPEELWTAMG